MLLKAVGEAVIHGGAGRGDILAAIEARQETEDGSGAGCAVTEACSRGRTRPNRHRWRGRVPARSRPYRPPRPSGASNTRPRCSSITRATSSAPGSRIASGRPDHPLDRPRCGSTRTSRRRRAGSRSRPYAIRPRRQDALNECMKDYGGLSTTSSRCASSMRWRELRGLRRAQSHVRDP